MAEDKPKTFAPFVNVTHHPPKPKAKFYRQIHGNLWGLSNDLSKLKSCTEPIDSQIGDEIQYIHENYPNYIKYFDFTGLFKINFNQLIDIGCNKIANLLYKYTMQFINTC
jgi:hypothetical protein